MRVLVVEDDFISRKLLTTLLGHYGECDIAVDGREAVDAYRLSLDEGNHYDLICMDIMMPKLDGQSALREIRELEKEKAVSASQEVKVIMTTALDDPKNVMEALNKGGAAAYLVKPLDKKKLIEEVKKLGLMD